MERAIEASVHLTEPLSHVRAALADDPGLLVASRLSTSGDGGLPFESSLAIEIGDTKVQQAVAGELGPSVWADDALVLSVRWAPVNHEHLLPTFAGEFELRAEPSGTRLVLRGEYTIPLGPPGRAGDRLVGRGVAQRVLDAHLAWVADHVDGAARQRAQARSDPDPEEGPGADYFIG